MNFIFSLAKGIRGIENEMETKGLSSCFRTCCRPMEQEEMKKWKQLPIRFRLKC